MGTVSRRDLIRLLTVGAAGLATSKLVGHPPASAGSAHPPGHLLAQAPVAAAPVTVAPPHAAGAPLGAVGEVDPARAAVDPAKYLTEFDWGKASRMPDGRTLREYRLLAQVKELEIAPGVLYPAWAYNGKVPGPTLRARQGDRLRIHFTNGTPHPHNIHFHGFHSAEMDGIESIASGKSFTYEFDADPFGLHLYHCHVQPLKRHIHKGLYGTFIIDPPQSRAPAREMVMMMNAFDTDFDGENEMYAVNTIPFYYMNHPIKVKQGELVRVYLVNVTEFDPINSFHLHANFFDVYRTGTRLTTNEFTDILMLCQAERAILEFRLKRPGRFMFHAHQSEFVELGWMSFFEAVANGAV